jgi:hypothetical protein
VSLDSGHDDRVGLRPGLLADRRVAFAGVDSSPTAQRLHDLGAELLIIPAPASDDEDAVAAWVSAHPQLEALVCDAREPFGLGGHERLRSALDQAWVCARAVATGALLPPAAGGRLVFVAPRADAGPLAEAARAGLESLARTVSVEWARHTVTAVAVCPGASTTEDDVADLIAFLLSAAGGYFSGCRFDLGLTGASGLS